MEYFKAMMEAALDILNVNGRLRRRSKTKKLAGLCRYTVIAPVPGQPLAIGVYLDVVHGEAGRDVWHESANFAVKVSKLRNRSRAEVLDLVRQRVNEAFARMKHVLLAERTEMEVA